MEKKPLRNGKLAKVTSIEKKLSEKKKELADSEREKRRMAPAKLKRVMLIAFVVLLIIVVLKGVFDIWDLRKQEKEVQNKLEEKLAEKEKLEQQKEYINSEEYIEQAARDMLKMIKPGEILFVLKDDTVLEKKDNVQGNEEKMND